MNTEWSRPTRYIAGISLALLGIYVLYLARPVIPLLIVAVLIAVIVRPVILWLHEGARLPRGLAVVLVYLILAILAPLALLLAFPAIVNAVRYVASLDYQSILQDILAWLRATLEGIQAAQLPTAAFDAYVDQTITALLTEIEQAPSAPGLGTPRVDTILQSLGSALAATFNAAAGLVGAVVSQAALLIFMFLASIYISLEAHTYRGKLLNAAPAAYRPEFAILLGRIERLWTAFFRGELALMLVIGVISWLGLTALGVPGAPYLGIVAGLLELIPNLGPVFATIPAVIVALLQGSTYLNVSPLVLAGLVILLYVLIQQLENSVIVPRVLGEAVGLPALVVMTGVLVGASTAGILGALLATPVVASGLEILRYVYQKMKGEEPFPPEEAAEPARRDSMDTRHRLRKWVQRLARSQPAAPEQRASEAAANEDGVTWRRGDDGME